jgi:hypothetical protein
MGQSGGMVFIGREMDEEAFREAFRRRLHHPEVQVCSSFCCFTDAVLPDLL